MYQVREIFSQLATSEAEVGRLMETQATVEMELHSKTSYLQAELSQATAQKEFQNEQILILHGKISALEEQLCRVCKEEKGENMGPVMEESQENAQLKEEQMLQENKRQEAAHEQQTTAYENQMTQLKEEIQQQQEKMDTLKKDNTGQVELLHQEIQTLRNRLETLNVSLTAAEEVVLTKEDLLVKQQLDGLAIQEALQEKIKMFQEEMQGLRVEVHGLQGQLECKMTLIRVAEEQIKAKEQQLAVIQQEKTEQADMLQKCVTASEKEVEKLREIQKDKVNLFLQSKEEVENLKAELSTVMASSAEKDKQLDGLREEVSVQADKVTLAKEEIQAKENMLTNLQMESSHQTDVRMEKAMSQYHSKKQLLEECQEQVAAMQRSLDVKDQEMKAIATELKLLQLDLDNVKSSEENLLNRVSSLETQVTKTEEEIQAKQELLTQMQKEIAEQRQSLLQEMQNLQLQVDSTHALLKESQENAQLKEEDMLQENTRQEAVHEQQKTACENQMAQLKEEIQQQQEKMDTLNKDSTGQVELLHQEIQTLRNRVETLSFSLTKAEEVVLTKEDLLAKQQLDGLAIQETLQEKIKMFQEEMQGLRVEVHGLQGQLECKTTSIRVAEEQIMAKEQQLAVIQQEKTEQAYMLQKCVAASEEEVEKLKEIQKAKDDLFLQSKEKVENLKAELSTVMASSAEKDNQLDSLREEVSVQADKVTLAKEGIQAKEVMLAQYQEDITLHKELLKQQVTKTEEEIQAKQELLTQMQKEIAEQRQSLLQEMQSLQLQVDSTRALLEKSQENAQLQEEQMLQENTRQEAVHEQQKTACENRVAQLKEEIQQQQEKMDTLKKDSTGQVELLHQEIQTLRNRVETLSFSLTKAEEVVLTKEDLLAKQQLDGLAIQETLQEKIKMFQEEMQGLRVEVHGLQGQLECKTTSIRVAEEQIMAKEQQLAVIQQEKAEQADMLQKCVTASEEEVEKLKEIQKAKDDLFLQSKEEVENLKAELSTVMASSAEKDNQLDSLREEVSVQADKVKLAKEGIQAKEDLLTNLQMESSHQTDVRVCEIHSLEVKVETITTTLINTKQELKTQQDICSKHQQENTQQMERLQEQLTAKSEAAEHYKTQMEKAMSHYNGKKQLLEESREQVAAMQRSLDGKDQEMKAIATELKLLQLDLDSVKSSEKNLLNRVASLESQMEKRDAADSLEDDTLEDSLNTTRRPSAPGKSSTPLVRSSERLAARRHPASAESLESLYFTPLAKSNSTKRHMDNSPSSSLAELALDSTRKNPLTSSVKRRRTTQVISITMSKTPGRGGSGDHHHHHDDEDHNNSFFSLVSARSQPNLSSSRASSNGRSPPWSRSSGRPVRLLPLPPATSCSVCPATDGAPPTAPPRYAARNKACLPHLKSTYPLESRPSIAPELTFTEDDLRMGDPTDTIRRASMMPGQLQDSLSSHRLSYMGTGTTRPHRHSLMPGQLSTRTTSCSQLSSSPHRSKRTATASSQHLYPCSPEGKVKASCFPRPLTPKNTRTALSPVQRRESMVFTIDNTPKKNYLQKGLNRLRSSTRKSPSKSLKAPATPATLTNPPTRVGTAIAKRGTTTTTRVAAATKGQRKSPRTGGSTAKSPGLTASARKMMSFRMKV
ncbi:hypothetical protein CRUP_028341 [Coryphaenoides rupestris]|nr:hypothetical protein CRUP_028341 [Coryphaenoides rupestris]